MKLSEKIFEQLQAEVEKSKSVDDLLGKNSPIKNLVKNLLEEMLGGELSAHLGYDKHDKDSKRTNNRHNGKSTKFLNGDYRRMQLDIPRDR